MALPISMLLIFTLKIQQEDCEQFTPGYATVDRILYGKTLAEKCGLNIGDCIVAINGEGFRRFAPEYEVTEDMDDLMTQLDGSLSFSTDDGDKGGDATPPEEENKYENKAEEFSVTEERKKLKYRVIPSGMNGGEAYKALIRKIKEVKDAKDPENPLCITLERYKWDSRENAWSRFLKAKNNDVPKAMKMIQEHEQWKMTAFPIDLRRPGLINLLKSMAIAEIKVEGNVKLPPALYVDVGRLMTMGGGMSTTKDILDSLLIHTELVMSKASNPCNPKLCVFVDLSEFNVKTANTEILKEIHSIFEPNFPETLEKMVIYPVPRNLRKTISALFNFVTKSTVEKFVLTEDLDAVCSELGWYRPMVNQHGGLSLYLKKHKQPLEIID